MIKHKLDKTKNKVCSIIKYKNMKFTKIVGLGATTSLIFVSAFAQNSQVQGGGNFNGDMGNEGRQIPPPPRREPGIFDRWFGGDERRDDSQGNRQEDRRGARQSRGSDNEDRGGNNEDRGAKIDSNHEREGSDRPNRNASSTASGTMPMMRGDMKERMKGMMASGTSSTTMKMMRNEMRDRMRGMMATRTMATGSMASMTRPIFRYEDDMPRPPQAEMQSEENVQVSIPKSIFLKFKSFFNF